ncbi:sensor domain-containing diguanylate cyclase [Xanthomonas theicola]|uniref:diguanylate cyclase n=1 Tax=Xanthomonas theicola TaxID=56464 RepID=A0A2S6ZEY4_9XANT|nr:sensor domain-containing diguanylate cyclase [Xanthomonas theicola]PPT90720.1 GGDEF domain-containing protein [Xanthomonas theicola]QNH26482.1 GGDEF domain-containing protein [Xanthomonas theicola]
MTAPGARQDVVPRLVSYFVAAMILLLVATTAYQAWIGYRHAFDLARITTENVSRAIGQHADDAIKEADILSLGIVERIEGDGLERMDRHRLHRLFQRQVRTLPQLHGIFVYDSRGNWLVTDKEATPANANNADCAYFVYHRTHAGRGVHVGEVITSRSTGELVIPVSRRIDRADGSFGGVFLTTLKLSYFSRFYSGFRMDAQGVVVLANDAGTILVRRPFDKAVIGRSIAKGEIFRTYLPRAPRGVATIVAITDKVERMYGYERLERYPLAVMAGISKRSILAPWYADLYRSLAMLGLALPIPVLFGFIMSRQIRRTLRAEDELRLAYVALEKIALHDSLTGLANRRQLDAVLPAEISRARRTSSPLGVIMLDIDHFKRYNDRYGHPAGDLCIKAVANAVKNHARRTGDLAVRYGGEELTVLLPSSDAHQTAATAERIVQAVRSLRIAHADSPSGQVTVSAGAYSFTAFASVIDAGELLDCADAALYTAKESGRDRVHVATSQC